MKQLSLMIDLNKCIGCRTCVAACRNYHEIIDHATAMPNQIPYYLRVESRLVGTYPEICADAWVIPCQHCSQPLCLEACPEGAIGKDPQTGIVSINKETCDGCNAVAGALAADKQAVSPCKEHCPAGINVQGYVRLVAKGKFKEALKLIKQDNPLPVVCGRACDHPCEYECNRSEIDEPVAINAIKRFVAELDLNSEDRYVPAVEKERDEKVAVIGSGPAGLTCAYFLRLNGYQVDIFEKDGAPGGMLTRGIPSYRLPQDLVDAEIKTITDMGVNIKTSVELGKDVTVSRLRDEGYKAVFIGVGTQVCQELGIEGEDLEGVYPVLDFLARVNEGKQESPGEKVAVIGGGNAALDAVRSARRLGSDQAFIIYRRGVEDMPAIDEEIQECLEEGIPVTSLTQPVRFIGENGKVAAIECVEMKLTDLDESGRKKPEPIAGSEFTVEVDAVITALGQEADWACLTDECACQLTDFGTMKIDPLTFQSDDPDIFAGGDAVTGPGTIVDAIAGGKEAAISIDRFIKGLDLRAGREQFGEIARKVQHERYDQAPRVQMPVLDPDERLDNFNAVQQGFTEEMAVKEAQRCLACGSACIQSCPYEVIQFNFEKGFSHKCDLCNERIHTGEMPVCVEVCLTDAIGFGEYELVKQSAMDGGLTIVEDLSKESHLYVR